MGVAEVGTGTAAGRFDGTEVSGTSRRVRFQSPVPGMLTLLYSPRGPTFTLNGAIPNVALRPWRVTFNLTPGMTLNDFRKRQLIMNLHFQTRCTKRFPVSAVRV